MYDVKKYLRAPQTRAKEHYDYWHNFEKTLNSQEIEISFKVGDTYYPSTMNSISSPYLCELIGTQLQFTKFNPQSLNFKKNQEVILSHDASEIRCVEINDKTGLDFIFGPFPVDVSYLTIDISFNNGQGYHLFSKYYDSIEPLHHWCQSNEVDFIDSRKTSSVNAMSIN